MQKLTYLLLGTDQYSVIISSVSPLVLYSLIYVCACLHSDGTRRRTFLVEERVVPKTKWSIRLLFQVLSPTSFAGGAS